MISLLPAARLLPYPAVMEWSDKDWVISMLGMSDFSIGTGVRTVGRKILHVNHSLYGQGAGFGFYIHTRKEASGVFWGLEPIGNGGRLSAFVSPVRTKYHIQKDRPSYKRGDDLFIFVREGSTTFMGKEASRFAAAALAINSPDVLFQKDDDGFTLSGVDLMIPSRRSPAGLDLLALDENVLWSHVAQQYAARGIPHMLTDEGLILL